VLIFLYHGIDETAHYPGPHLSFSYLILANNNFTRRQEHKVEYKYISVNFYNFDKGHL